MNMSSRQIMAAAVGAAVILVLIWYVALFRPQSSDLKSAHQAYQQATTQIQQLRSQVASLQALEHEIPADKARLATLTAALPKTTDLHGALDQLHTLATGTGVQLTAVDPSPDNTSGSGQSSTSYKTVKLTMTASGPYPNMMSFVTGLDRMARTVVVDSASFSQGSAGALTASLNARIFYAP